MRRLLTVLAFFCGFAGYSYSQTCTATSSGGTNGGDKATWSCGSPSSFTGDLIVIPDGITVTISNSQSWETSVEVRGTMIFENQLSLGSESGCGLTFIVTSTGLIQDGAGSSSNDRLSICSVTVITSQDNPAPSAPTQVWPSGGFSNTGFDEFGEDASLLPVELLSFQANAYNREVVLSWQTATELNNDYFTIERSKDGVNYTPVATIAGAGTSNQIQFYHFSDERPFSGTSYYRLRQTDFDGTTEVFRPASVYHEGNEAAFSLYPNPLNQDKLIRLTSDFIPQSNIHFSVYNLYGQEVFSRELSSGVSGYLDVELDLSHLFPGSYLVSVKEGQNEYRTKLVKK